MESRIPVCLSIGGSDSCGGAGVQADQRSIEACGIRACTAITALTAQNPDGISRVTLSPLSQIEAEIRAIFDYYDVRAVKTGMLANADIVHLVALLLEELHPNGAVVIDPVMVSTSGTVLLAEDARDELETGLFPLASLITPNIPEAEALLGEAGDGEATAHAFYDRYRRPILLKGGHDSGSEVRDLLFDGNEVHRYLHGRQQWNSDQAHGSGCRLAATVAAYLSLGDSLPEATGHAITRLFPQTDK